MNYHSLKLIFFIILAFTSILHVHSITHSQQNTTLEDQQFNKLNQQQKSLQSKINLLLSDVKTIQKNVSVATNSSEKVVLLQNSILSQRQKLFNMQNQLIPPFTLSKTACLQLTNAQKINMLDKIKVTKAQIIQLQKQLLSAPKCDKIDSLLKDVQKQLTLLQSLQKTINTQCQSKSVLTPTIYQTNIYADGWILGDQNIDDLIQQYYQRNIKYHNITNCPLQKPFFNGQQCILCTDPQPVFNVLTRQCTHCPQDQQPDSNLRKCVIKPHYTNFTAVQNWALDGATMPVPNKQLVPCPSSKPYYDGKKCQQCLMPKYWNIRQNGCLQCPIGTLFDLNTKKCQKPQRNDLTILQGTRWVTNDCNLTRIIQERVNILNLNKTQGDYKMCPSDKPFFDGITCINCPNQFNIDTRKCLQSPEKSIVYDENVRCYVRQQTGFQTNPKADRYTSTNPLQDTAIPNCKKAQPYYDGLSCIDCLKPFPIFNVDKKRCTACNPEQIYNNDEHKCIPRDKIYISTNENKLMTTQKMSIDDYHAEIAQKIKDNPQSLILLCQQTQYSDYKKCFNCNQNYFNIETKQCVSCGGFFNKATNRCQQCPKNQRYSTKNQKCLEIAYVTNTNAMFFYIEEGNYTKNSIDDRIYELQKDHVIVTCDSSHPYWNGTDCIHCAITRNLEDVSAHKPFFNLKSLKCQACSNWNNETKKCKDTLTCSQPTPYLDPVTNTCIACKNGTVYNPSTSTCQACKQGQIFNTKTSKCERWVTNTTSLNNNYIQQANGTKQNLNNQIEKIKAAQTVFECPSQTPMFLRVEGKCIKCNDPKPYWNILRQICVKCDNVTADHKCEQALPRFKMNVEDFYGTIFGR